VALTRCTSRLAIVHAKPLPDVLGLAEDPPDTPAPQPEGEHAGEGVVVDLAGRADDGSDAVVVNLQVVDDEEPSGAVVVDLAQALGQAGAMGAEEGNILDPIDAAIARDAFDGLERQIAQAIAATVAERIIATIRPELLGAVADELSLLLHRDGEDRRG
jgi:hypothetical protein